MADTPKRPTGKQKPQKDAAAKQQKARSKAAKKESRHWYWTAVKIGSMSIGGLIVLGLGAGTGYAASMLKDLPSITASTFTNLSQSSVVYDRNGKIIGQFVSQGKRDPITSLSQVSPNLTNSFIAAEDKTFWTNIGINPVAMGRAFLQDTIGHHIESGASTITQQTVKLAVFPEQQRTIRRKVQEIALAIKLNHILTKQEIMVDYMNWVYFGRLGGNPVYGVKAASNVLFGKDPNELNLAESAILASIPNNPSIYDPYTYDPKVKGNWRIDLTNITKRQHYILQQMLKNGTINQQQYDDAMNFDIAKAMKHPTQQTTNSKYMYLMEDEIPFLVEQDLVNAGVYQNTQEADAALSTGGFKIHTTIDLKKEDIVNNVLRNPKWYRNYDIPRGKSVNHFETGFTLIDNSTGQILAIGGGNFKTSVDHSDVPRQPGSSMKPLVVYGPALELHKITAASPLRDAPIPWYNKGNAHDDEPGWRGIVTARKALYESYNIPAIELLNTIGVQNGESFLPKMGITDNSRTITGRRTWVEKPIPVKQNGKTVWVSDQNLSAAIGGLTYGLTVQEMTSAYSTFANGGVWKSPYMIAQITDPTGKVVYQNKQTVNRVFSPQAVYVLDSMMRDVVLRGTAGIIGSYFPGNDFIYGKTGTSDHEHDGWFVGFTKTYTAGIWEGYDIPAHIWPGTQYNEKFQMWDEIMSSLVKNSDHSELAQPSGIVHATVCPVSGMLPNAICKQKGGLYNEVFIAGTEPTQIGHVWEQLAYTVINGVKYLATTNTPPGEIQIGDFLNPPWKITPVDMQANDSKNYAPQKPDPRGGTVLPPLDSNTLVQPPAPPAGLGAQVQGNSVMLNWQPENGVVGYMVWRATSPKGPFTQLTQSPIQSTTFMDTALPPGAATVYYEVMAVSSTSGASKPATIPVQFGSPPPGPGQGQGQTGNANGQ